MGNWKRAGSEISGTYLLGRVVKNVGWILLGIMLGAPMGAGYFWVKGRASVEERVEAGIERRLSEVLPAIEAEIKAALPPCTEETKAGSAVSGVKSGARGAHGQLSGWQ